MGTTPRPGTRPLHRAAAVAALALTVSAAAAFTTHVDPPANASAAGPAQAGACTVRTNKVADPAQVTQGQMVTVTLSVAASCTGQARPVDVVLAIDRSVSMARNHKFDAATRASQTFLQAMDPQYAHVALVAFSGSAELVEPLTDDFLAVERAIRGIDLRTGTNVVAALDAAFAELTGPRARPGVPQAIVFLTDGRHASGPDITTIDPIIAATHAAGIEVFAIGLGSDADAALLRRIASDADHYFDSAEPEALDTIYENIALSIEAQRVLKQATIEDRIPDNMQYVRGSGEPIEPSVSPDGKLLTWRFTDVMRPGLTLSYRLRPLEVGTWPTNVEAGVDYVDAYDVARRRDFPVPTVTVVAGPPVPDCVCRAVRERVPPSVIAAALANPNLFEGWGMPLDPGKPPGPSNPVRACLSLLNPNLDYNTTWNRPVWRSGCP